ncbi:hypothetical protein V8C42DRAFT_342407 [Trichoderma barbatum]
MRQLELLSCVIPAFGALAKDYLEVGIGKVPRRTGLENEQIDRLLKALESRLPQGWILSMPNKVHSGQSSALRHRYLSSINPAISLFHEKGKTSKAAREKFLSRIREATEHLLDVYFRLPSEVDGEEFDLSKDYG